MSVQIMSIDLLAPIDPVIQAAYRGLSAVADGLQPFAGDASAVLAVLICTIAIRLLLTPLSRAQLRAVRTQARIAPQLGELRRRYPNDSQCRQREMTALYRREGVSPFGGCLPGLVQMPFFIVLYRLVSSPLIGGHANLLLTNSVFGLPLGGHLLGAVTAPFGAPAAVFAVLLALLAGVAWWSSRTTMPGLPVSRLQRIMPFGTVLAAAVVPFAAGLYMLTSSTWATAERAVLYRRMARIG